MGLFGKYKAVKLQRDDFQVFKENLSNEMKKTMALYKKEMDDIDSSTKLNHEEKKIKKEKFDKLLTSDLNELKLEAKEYLKKADDAKTKQFSEWRTEMRYIFFAWFALLTAGQMTNIYIIAKYLIIIGGLYVVWISLVDISLYGQRASFARDVIKKTNIFLKRKFCYLRLNEESFIDGNGLTQYYVSTTRVQIEQHWNIIKFMFAAFFVNVIQDVYPLIKAYIN